MEESPTAARSVESALDKVKGAGKAGYGRHCPPRHFNALSTLVS